MKRKKQKRRLKDKRKRLLWKQRIIVLAMISLVLFLIILHPQLKVWRLEKELQTYQRQERALKQEQREILSQIRYYSSDAYVEKTAREDLGLVKPGEVPLLPAVPGHVQEPPKKQDQAYE